jgi:hypothetical protein
MRFMSVAVGLEDETDTRPSPPMMEDRYGVDPLVPDCPQATDPVRADGGQVGSHAGRKTLREEADAPLVPDCH